VFTWVEVGKLVAQQQWFSYATPKHTVVIITETSKPSEKLCANESYRLHHTFATNFAPHHFNVITFGRMVVVTSPLHQLRPVQGF
jgi:hypothetical protein